MAKRIALLRAVNVGGRKVVMSELADLFGRLGLGPARTLQAAGSVVFSGQGEAADVEALIEAGVAEHLGVATAVLVRDAEQWAATLAANPFPVAARDHPSRLMVMPLKAEPAIGGAEALVADGGRGEQVACVGRCAYLFFPNGVGDTKLTPRLIERRLGAVGTARNWNTSLKLAELLSSPA